MQTKLAKALKELEDVRQGIEQDLLNPAVAPAEAEVVAKTKDAVAMANAADIIWRKRAFDYSTIFVVVGGLVGIFLPRASWQTTTSCPGGRASCGKDFVWEGYSDQTSALAWAAGLTAVALILIATVFIGRSGGGLVGLLVGKDNRLSTSKFQVLIWTIAIVFTFVFFVAQLAFTDDTTGFELLNAEYLLLLGGPFGASVLAQQVTTAKENQGSVQQTPAAKPGTGDLVQDGSENAAIADTQFLLFNLVALAYFAVALAKTPTVLPDLPDTLVGLTSVSALTYLGAKVVNSNAPKITSVSLVESADGKLRGGAKLRILGLNFVPLQNPESELATVVLFGAVEVIPDRVSDREILLTVPAGLMAGAIDIAVRTSAGQLSDPPSRTLEYTA